MRRQGTRCAVCVGCGRCLASSVEPGAGAGAAEPEPWSGERCAVCVGCGRCARAWGLAAGAGVDAVSGATDWASAFKALDDGAADAAPARMAPPGVVASAGQRSGGTAEPPGPDVLAVDARPDGATWAPTDAGGPAASSADGLAPALDAMTGATPGVATACKELGLGAKVASLGLRPLGIA